MSRTQRPTVGAGTACQGGLVWTMKGWGLASHSAVSPFLSGHRSQPPAPDVLSAGQDGPGPRHTPPLFPRCC